MTSAKTIRIPAAALLAAALSAMIPAAPADAQVQVQNGNAIDANQQQGSFGINAFSDQQDFRARNLLVTGNVGGGRSFRGTVNYGAEGQFRGALAGDALFRFERDSVFSVPGAAQLQTGGLADRVIFTRPTTTLPGATSALGAQFSNRAQFDASQGVLSYRQAGGGLIAVTGVNNPINVMRATQSLGLVETRDGLLSIDASPLTGIQYNPLDVNTGLNNRLRQGNQLNANNLLDANRSNPLNPNGNLPNGIDPDDPEFEQTFGPQPSSLNQQRRIDGRYQPSTRNANIAGLGLEEDPLAITLGTQVQNAMALQLAGRTDNNSPNAQAQSIRQQLFGKNTDPNQNPNEPATAPKPPQGPYEKLIADILAQAKSSEDDPDAQDPDPNAPVAKDWTNILDKPEDEELEKRSQAREDALRERLGLVDKDGNIDYNTPLPKLKDDSELGRLLNQLDYDLPRVRTLAGEDANRISKLMTKAEQELKDGQYLRAENIYRQVLLEKKNDPLAKAGLVHSQMGAGMIRSAAFNLRNLFSNHPELIALRYEQNLMPQADRLRWLQGRIQKMIAEDEQGADPGLVLAYLGYQLDAKPLVKFGLDVAEAKAPRDPLMPVLRRIWIDGTNPPAQPEAEEQD